MPEIPKIDIRPDHWEIIQTILKKNVPQYEVWAFGSRARWTAKQYSDLDLAVITDKALSLATSAELSDDLAESDLPWRVDIVDWATTSEAFRKIIEKDKVVVQRAVAGLGGVMSADWPEVRLGDITSKLGDGLHGTPKYDENGEYYFINGNNLGNGKIVIDEKTKRATEEEYLKYKKELNNRTILISINGTIGNVGLFNGEKVFLGKSACYFNVNEDVDKQFVRYVMTSNLFQNHINSLATGSTIKNVSLKLMRDFTFKLPPLDIQQKTAKILEDLDKKIELNNQANQTLEQIAQAIFKSWFVDFEPVKAKIQAKQNDQDPERAAMCAISGKSLEELDQLSPEAQQQLKTTATLFPDALVKSELGEIPGGWNIKPLSEIAENHSTTFDFTKIDEVVFVNTGDVLDGRFLHKSYISKEGLPGQAKKTIMKDDVLYSEIRPKNKRFAYVSEDCDDYVVSTKFMIIRSLGFVHPRYLYQILRQTRTIKEFNLIAESRSGTFPQITFDSIGYLPIVVPCESIQKSFMDFFSPIVEKIELVVEEEKSLEKLRDALLPKLLSGEIHISKAQSVTEAVAC